MRADDLKKYAEKNGEYYTKFLTRFEADSNFLSWNWWAFFFFPFWLLYRKLWKEFIVLMFFSTFITVVVLSSAYFFEIVTYLRHVDELYYISIMILSFYSASPLFIPMFLRANASYLKQAKKVIDTKNFKIGAGRSVLAVWIYIAILVISGAYIVWYIETHKLPISRPEPVFKSLGFEKEKNDIDPKLIALKEALSQNAYDQNWTEMERLVVEQEDLSALSSSDFTFRIIFSLIDNEQTELLELLVTKKLDIPTVSKSSGRDFEKYAYKEKKWKALHFLMTKGGYDFKRELWLKQDSYSELRPMQELVKNQDIYLIEWLIEQDIPVKAKFYQGKSPLMLAAEISNLEIIKLLIKAGANPKYTNLEDKNAISISQTNANKKIQEYFKNMIENNTFTIKKLNKAIANKDLLLVKTILASGLDANRKSNDFSSKLPLEKAIDVGDVKILDYILSHGVEVNQAFEDGDNALNYALSQNNGLELMRCLLKHGAVVNIVDPLYHNPMDHSFAPRGDWLDRTRLLLEHNASLITVINRDEQLALHASLKHSDKELTNLIIDKMVQEGHAKYLSSADINGDTPLHYATRYNRITVIKKLLKLQVDAKIVNKRKMQAIANAYTQETLELLEPYSDHKPSISQSYCTVYVEQKFDKGKRADCEVIAKHYEKTNKHAKAIWYYFLANNLEKVKTYTLNKIWLDDCDCNGNDAYMAIADAYLLSGDIENTKKYYHILINILKQDTYYSIDSHLKKWINKHFILLEGLHPNYGKKAKNIWRTVWREKFKEEFFDIYK